ncbi:MAG: FMN-binding protein [Coriobacteriaceae bacterium]|nr:FMN-binding protein [Coriobacteriaceae bacterium]
MRIATQILAKLKSSSIWLFLPVLLVAGAVGFTVSGYDPLMFDASAFASSAQKPSLATTSAAEAGDPDAAAGTPAPAGAKKMATTPATDAPLADGTFTGYAPCGVGNGDGWKPYYVAVTITVKGGKVVSIDRIAGSSKGGGATLNWDPGENQKYLDWAISGRGGSSGVKTQLNNAIASGKTPSGIDTVSGATYSSVAIYNAFAAAMKKSAAKAGKKAEPTKEQQPSSSSSTTSSTPPAVQADDDVSGQKLADGAWVGYAPCGVGNDEDWSPYYVAVTVQVSNGAVTGVSSIEGSSTGEAGDVALNWNADENQVYLDWAVGGRTRGGTAYAGVADQISKAIAAGGNPASIDVVSGATYSSTAILQAYYAALRKSAAAAGSTIDDPAGASADPGDDTAGSGTSDPGGDEGSSSSSASESSGSEDPGSGSESSSSAEDPGSGSESSSSTEGQGGYVDGVYTGIDLCGVGNDDGWKPYYVVVQIEVEDGKVARISDVYGDTGSIDPQYVYDSKENATYLNKAISGTPRKKGVKTQIQARLDAGQEVAASDIDTLSSATISSESIIAAYFDALASVPMN